MLPQPKSRLTAALVVLGCLLLSGPQVNAGDKIHVGSVQLEVKALPSVDFSGDSMFDNPSGTVIRRISDFNSEFGLDAEPAAAER